jgi:hypothetical protein
MQSKTLWGGCLATAIFLSSNAVALADIGFRQVSASQSQGQGGKDVPTLEVSPVWGLTISFIKTNELVQQVRIGDPARVLVDFDAPLVGGDARPQIQGNTQGRTMNGASVIYLRQIGEPLKIHNRLTRSAKKSNKIPLTVITIDRSNQRKLYQFVLVLGKETKYSTVEVVPDSQLPRSAPSAAPNSSGATVATVPSGDVAQQFAKGLAIANKNNIVVPASPLDQRLQVVLQLLQKGETLETAAQKADVPLSVVQQIMLLKS